jgi:hypothetical protein
MWDASRALHVVRDHLVISTEMYRKLTPRTTLVNQGKEMVVRMSEHHVFDVPATRCERV